jgi:hypothetical protein
MPGARDLRIVTMKLPAVSVEAIELKTTPSVKKSMLRPGSYVRSASGT